MARARPSGGRRRSPDGWPHERANPSYHLLPVNTSEPKFSFEQALRAAERFKSLFPLESHARWCHAGDLRRRRTHLAELAHVVQPLHDTAPLFDPDKLLMGENKPLNQVWLRLDQLLAAAQVQKVYLGAGQGFAWHDHYRVVIYQGIRHRLLICDQEQWGIGLVAATGPKPFVAGMWKRLADLQYRIRPGLRLVGPGGESLAAPTEEKLFELARLPYLAPERRDDAAVPERPTRRERAPK